MTSLVVVVRLVGYSDCRYVSLVWHPGSATLPRGADKSKSRLDVRTMHCQTTISLEGELRLEGSDIDRPQLLCELLLRKHRISLCCISEHRWRGEGTLQCGECLYMLTCLPAESPKAMQGVAVLMDSEIQVAWRRAGSYADSHGGRLLHVSLELKRRIAHVISVYYAPTFNTEAMIFVTRFVVCWER